MSVLRAFLVIIAFLFLTSAIDALTGKRRCGWVGEHECEMRKAREAADQERDAAVITGIMQ